MTPRDLCELQTCGLPRPTAAAAALWAASLLEQRLLPSHHPGLWEDLSFPVFQVTLPEVPIQILKHSSAPGSGGSGGSGGCLSMQ